MIIQKMNTILSAEPFNLGVLYYTIMASLGVGLSIGLLFKGQYFESIVVYTPSLFLFHLSLELEND